MNKMKKGNQKSCGNNETTKNGYQELWDTGRAHNIKNKNKVTGTNRPSV
ncbi:hypothetical protein ACOBQJ_00445 [Pelotomaculum propionicicum]